MKPQRLDRVLTCYRIGDPDGIYPIFDGCGAALVPGRWNEVGQQVIYACEHYSTAMLEKLARGRGGLPRNQHYITITIPDGASYEVVGRDHLSGWDTPEPTVARTHGAAWAAAGRSLILLVPLLRRPDRAQHRHQPGAPGIRADHHQPARAGLVGRAAMVSRGPVSLGGLPGASGGRLRARSPYHHST